LGQNPARAHNKESSIISPFPGVVAVQVALVRVQVH